MGAPHPARAPLGPGGHGISAGGQLEEPAEVILDHRSNHRPAFKPIDPKRIPKDQPTIACCCSRRRRAAARWGSVRISASIAPLHDAWEPDVLQDRQRRQETHEPANNYPTVSCQPKGNRQRSGPEENRGHTHPSV
jgi:hypothetical protein